MRMPRYSAITSNNTVLMKAKNLTISQNGLIVVAILFLMLFANMAFFKGVVEIYPARQNIAFLVSLFIVFAALNTILVSLLCYKHTIKPILMVIFLISSFAAYFMDSYRSVIDEYMIDNILQTNTQEFIDLFSLQQVMYVLLLGVLPSILIYNVNIKAQTFLQSVFSRLKLLLALILVVAGVLWGFSDYYYSFFREHTPLRYYSNPGYYLYSATNYATRSYRHSTIQLKPIALDAKIPTDNTHRKLMIFVVGETVRADHFSLNGYDTKTNPLLEKLNVINFSNTSSCGTSTAHSLPCMFSVYPRHNYNKSKADNTENVLDILRRVGVNVLWLDNNSSSKGVADRVHYQNYNTPDNNPICDSECRDEGMLVNLQAYIDSHSSGDFLIVLHQMGNHGPAYYKRYPKKFERFTPVCKTNQLEQCTIEQISNAYDNTILYTDYFLAKTIAFLKQNSTQFESALFYASDHGESLGENGLYLHGLPYFMAPKSQTHVPMFIWLDNGFGRYDEADIRAIKDATSDNLSHDNIFHTILGFMQVETDVYDKKMNIINPHRKDD